MTKYSVTLTQHCEGHEAAVAAARLMISDAGEDYTSVTIVKLDDEDPDQ